MKKIIFLAICCTSTMILIAQNDRNRNDQKNAPQEVQRSWQKDYPNNNASWDMRNNQWHTRYQDRDHNNRYVDVYYDRHGKRMRSEGDWDRNDLPANIRDRMRNRYHTENYKVYRIDRPGRGVFFQIGWGNKKIYFDERGRETRYY